MDNEKLYEDMKPKEKFEVLWAESGLADRPGAENLWQQMVALGFFEKPASIKHHSNHPGGLCEHSVCVAEAAMELCRANHAFKSATGMKFLQRRSCMIIARWASTAIRETVSTNILTPVWWATEKEASLWHSSISS